MGSAWQNQLKMARKENKKELIRHAVTGHRCGCGCCFYCAALEVLETMQKKETQEKEAQRKEAIEIGHMCGCNDCFYCRRLKTLEKIQDMETQERDMVLNLWK